MTTDATESAPKPIKGFRIKNITQDLHHVWSPAFDVNVNDEDRSGGLLIPGQVCDVPDVVRKIPFFDEEGKRTLRDVSLRAEVIRDMQPGGRLHKIVELSTETPKTARQIAEQEKKKQSR
jgi:hypothetical protein